MGASILTMKTTLPRAWASCFILGEHGLRFISFQLHLFFFPHLEVCLRQRLSAAVWEAVKHLGCSWSALTKWMPNFPLDFQKTQHSVKSGWVRFVFMTNFIFFLLLSFLFFNWERLPSSGACLFFSKSKRLPSSGTCHFLLKSKRLPSSGARFSFKVKKAPLIGNMSFFSKSKRLSSSRTCCVNSCVELTSNRLKI